MIRGRPDDQRVYLVFTRYARELVIVLGAESIT